MHGEEKIIQKNQDWECFCIMLRLAKQEEINTLMPPEIAKDFSPKLKNLLVIQKVGMYLVYTDPKTKCEQVSLPQGCLMIREYSRIESASELVKVLKKEYSFIHQMKTLYPDIFLLILISLPGLS